MSGPGSTRPDLCSTRAISLRAEFTEAVRRLLGADGYPLTNDDPLAPLARDVARFLVETGFTLHHCNRQDPLYRLSGVYLMPILAETGTGRSGVAVCWTIRNLLLLDGDRYGSSYRRIYQLMNGAPGGVLHGFVYSIQQLGTDGAWLMTGRCGQRTGAGR